MKTLIFALSLLVSLSALADKTVTCQSPKSASSTTVVVISGRGANQSAEIRVFDRRTDGYKILGQYQVTQTERLFFKGSPRTRIQDHNQKFFLTIQPKTNHLRATVANGSKLDMDISCTEI